MGHKGVSVKNYKAYVISAAFAVFGAVGMFGYAQPAQAANCTPGTNYKQFTGSVSGRDTLTVQTKDGLKLCDDVKMNFTTYKIMNTYNGKGFSNNPTALPQQSVYNQTIVLKKGTTGKTTVKVQVPEPCVDYQIDAYLGPVQTKITTNEGLVNTNAIAFGLFQRTQKNCEPVVKNVQVCDIATKQTVTVTEDQAKDTTKYAPVDSEKCKETPVTPPTPPVTPPTPPVTPPETPEVPQTPPELPETGPAAAIMQLFGAGSMVASAAYYVQSRRS